MYDPRNASLTLKVNRLSGRIPSVLMNATDLDILDGECEAWQ